MHVLALQLDSVWENKAANHARVLRLLQTARPEPRSLVVLPEMFATGFSMNVAGIADHGETQEFLAKLAREFGVWVLGGFVTAGDGQLGRNEAALFDITGQEITRYQKVHPFRYAGETKYFEPGTKAVVVACNEFQLAPIICYDLRFPELFRADLRGGADLFAVIANWPTPRLDHWLTLLKARAIENQAYVIGVNRCGRDPNVAYPGRTQIISPRGEVLTDGGEAEGVVRAELDLTALQGYRREFPVLEDRRNEI
jgi:predicted amidohydrolase